MILSSANKIGIDIDILFIHIGRSFIYRRNNRGPRMEPCGDTMFIIFIMYVFAHLQLIANIMETLILYSIQTPSCMEISVLQSTANKSNVLDSVTGVNDFTLTQKHS
jgi:hypothetical protein